MRDFFGRAPGMLARLDTGGKLVYSAFLAMAVAGLATAALLHGDGMGASVESTAAYWRGDEAQMLYAKSFRQLVELTHFHLFTEPVTFLVVAHLYNLTGDRGGRKLAVVGATLLGMVLQIALPWAITYGGAGWAALMLPAHAALTLGLLYMSAIALVEMWLRRSSSS